jgi:hypothetical protein
MHLYKILDILHLVNPQVILLEERAEVIHMVLPLVLILVLHSIMGVIRKNSRKILLIVLVRIVKVQLLVVLLLISPLLDQVKEGPPLRLSHRPVLADLSFPVHLLLMDVVADSLLLSEAHEGGTTVVLRVVETSLVTVLQLAIGAIMTLIPTLCGTVILGRITGIILLLQLMALLSFLEIADRPILMPLLYLVPPRDVIGAAMHPLFVATGAPLKMKRTSNQALGRADHHHRLLLKEIVMSILLEVQTGQSVITPPEVYFAFTYDLI